jgi:hypothetical protein
MNNRITNYLDNIIEYVKSVASKNTKDLVEIVFKKSINRDIEDLEDFEDLGNFTSIITNITDKFTDNFIFVKNKLMFWKHNDDYYNSGFHEIK